MAALGVSAPSAEDNAAEAPTGSLPTAAQKAVEQAKAVTLPSNGARRQLMFSKRRLCLKSALESHGNVVGIMGAADEGRWNPATDPDLAAGFTHGELTGKRACKRALQERAGLAPRNDAPLAVACPGLLPEDGAEQLADAAEDILALDVQFALLGSGPPDVASRFNSLARDQKQRMAVLDPDAVSPQVALAGADLVLSPANWAPWGRLVQAGQKYGAVPVVHATGGLDDLVVDWDPRTRTGSGFKYRRLSVDGLLAAIKRAKEMFDDDDPEQWSTLCRNNMIQGYTWKDAARRCIELYSGIVKEEN
jgi:starch synthase